MRLRVKHEIVHRFEPAGRGLIQTCHLAPRDHDGQHVLKWRVSVDVDCGLKLDEDSFGNFTQAFSLDGPVETLKVRAEGEIDTFDTAGIVKGGIERFPPELYLRSTPLTQGAAGLLDFAGDSLAGETEPLAKLHALLPAVCNTIDWIKKLDAGAPRSAAEVFARKAGDARDIAHVFVACARLMNIPARFVSGYCVPGEGEAEPSEAGHFWAEAWTENQGWIGFDPAIGICPQESHVRLACGLDWLGAAGVRAAQTGGARHASAATIVISRQRQKSP